MTQGAGQGPDVGHGATKRTARVPGRCPRQRRDPPVPLNTRVPQQAAATAVTTATATTATEESPKAVLTQPTSPTVPLTADGAAAPERRRAAHPPLRRGPEAPAALRPRPSAYGRADRVSRAGCAIRGRPTDGSTERIGLRPPDPRTPDPRPHNPAPTPVASAADSAEQRGTTARTATRTRRTHTRTPTSRLNSRRRRTARHHSTERTRTRRTRTRTRRCRGGSSGEGRIADGVRPYRAGSPGGRGGGTPRGVGSRNRPGGRAAPGPGGQRRRGAAVRRRRRARLPRRTAAPRSASRASSTPTGNWFAGNARLWFLGDFTDRGPDGIGVIDLVMRLSAEAAAAGGYCKALMGNHELLLLGAKRFGDTPVNSGAGTATFQAAWLLNGGQKHRHGAAGRTTICSGCPGWTPSRRPTATCWCTPTPPAYLDYGDTIEAVNDTDHRGPQRNDADECWDLFRKFTKRFAFRDEARPERRTRTAGHLRRQADRARPQPDPVPAGRGRQRGRRGRAAPCHGSACVRRRAGRRHGRRRHHGRKTPHRAAPAGAVTPLWGRADRGRRGARSVVPHHFCFTRR